MKYPIPKRVLIHSGGCSCGSTEGAFYRTLPYNEVSAVQKKCHLRWRHSYRCIGCGAVLQGELLTTFRTWDRSSAGTLAVAPPEDD